MCSLWEKGVQQKNPDSLPASSDQVVAKTTAAGVSSRVPEVSWPRCSHGESPRCRMPWNVPSTAFDMDYFVNIMQYIISYYTILYNFEFCLLAFWLLLFVLQLSVLLLALVVIAELVLAMMIIGIACSSFVVWFSLS